jgi:hypothetical protein
MSHLYFLQKLKTIFMKNLSIYFTVIFIFFLTQSSCVKKEIIPDDIQVKVNNWLNAQKSIGKSNENIELLKNNLDFNNSKIYNEIDKCDLLIIPIKDKVKISKKLS